MRLKIEKIWPRFPTFSLRSFLPRRLLSGIGSVAFRRRGLVFGSASVKRKSAARQNLDACFAQRRKERKVKNLFYLCGFAALREFYSCD